MKKLIPAIVFLLIIAGFAGVLWYMNAGDKTYDLEDTSASIETKELWRDESAALGGPEDCYPRLITKYKEIMNNSEATFFIGEIVAKTQEEFGFNGKEQITSITQTDKATFEETIRTESRKLSNTFARGVKHFLNQDYESVEKYFADGAHAGWGNDLFGASMNNRTWITDDSIVFGTNIRNYFNEHKLVLSCKSVKSTKLCAANVPFMYEGTSMAEIVILIGTAEVTTENCTGDMSDLGIFGNEGETVTVEFIAYGTNQGVDGCNFKRIN